MIGLLRRKKSTEDLWSTDLELEPETAGTSELSSGAAVLLSTRMLVGERQTNDINVKEHYRAVLESAIERGGWYQGQMISVAWLRMTLAGLDLRPFPPEAMWEEERSGVPAGPYGDMPSYEDLFPTEKSLAARLS